MLSVEAALARYASVVEPLPTEAVAIGEALGRVLAADARAMTDLPAFTQSAVDGYALRVADTTGASRDTPSTFEVIGEIAAGAVRDSLPAVASQAALRIFTGAPLPRDCDAVVRQEYVQREGSRIKLTRAVEAGADVRRQGEELRRGAPLAAAGTRLTPGLLAALAMAGVDAIGVRQRARIRILVTGDEVAPAGEALTAGRIYDANGPLMCAWLRARGYREPLLQYVRDDADDVETALAAAFDAADLVITSGGVSVGDRDYIPAAAERAGAEPLFWKVAQKPGKPLFCAQRGRTLLLGLPGNPAAVLVGLVVHARRVLDCLEGMHEPGPRFYPGRLVEPLAAERTRARLLRVRRDVNADGLVELHPLPHQNSHMLSNLAHANALAWVPQGEAPLARGALVRWTPL